MQIQEQPQNKVHQAIDGTANALKTVCDAYHGAFFSEEAQERYEALGGKIADGAIWVLEHTTHRPSQEDAE